MYGMAVWPLTVPTEAHFVIVMPGMVCVDILDHNKKIILGLIWALILRYQIVGVEAGTVVIGDILVQPT